MSKVTMEQMHELHQQIKSDRVTREVMQKMLDNAVKMHLESVFMKYVYKADDLLKKPSVNAFFGNSAKAELALAFAEYGRFDVARDRALALTDDEKRLETLLEVNKIAVASGGMRVIENYDLRKIAKKIGGWRGVEARLKIFRSATQAADIDSADELARSLPDPLQQTNSEDEHCFNMALAFFRINEVTADYYAERARMRQRLELERVRILLDRDDITSAIEVIKNITDIWVKVEALSMMVLSNMAAAPGLALLKSSMQTMPTDGGYGFAWADFAGVMARIGEFSEAEEIAKCLFPSAKAKAYQHIAEAYVEIRKFEQALGFAKIAGNEYNASANSYAAVAKALAETGDFNTAREVAGHIELDSRVLGDLYCQIGILSKDEKDFDRAFEVAKLRSKKDKMFKAELIAKICVAIAKAMK